MRVAGRQFGVGVLLLALGGLTTSAASAAVASVTITAQPAAAVNVQTAKLTFRIRVATSKITGISCQLDGAGAPCGTTTVKSPTVTVGKPRYRHLSEGSHTFSVVVTLTTGGPLQASASWLVDLTPPTLAPVVTPNPVALNATAAVAANAADSGSGVAETLCDPVDTTTLGTHTVSCTATDQAGNMAQASASYVVADVPDAPAIGSAADAGGGSASVTWTAPADNDSPITGYTVEAQPGGATADTGTGACTGSNCSATIESLTPCTTYTFTVTATNGMGTSQASAASNQVTPMIAPPAPAAPSVTAKPASLGASWSAPGGSCGIDEYELDAYDTATNTLRGTLTTSATSGQISGLPACVYPAHSCSSPTTYYLTLRAHNSAGWGPTVSSSSVRPLVSFTGDSIATVFSTTLSGTTCNACHFAGSGNRLVLSTQPYQNILSVLAGRLNQIYICPTGTPGCESPSGVHPGGTEFTNTSKEYALLAQWVTDGAQQ